ncbi:MAG: glycosyltransferase family 4 protein [Nitrospinae bacterium]|nr:glycosyltransferase family 4 protein [Nitrospinota bacterium]
MPMRIGVDIRELADGKMTGIGRYLLHFLKWAARERTEVNFFLYANQFTRLSLEAQNFRVRVMPEKITFLWDQVLLPVQLKKDRINAFLSPYYKAPIFSPCPACITIHDLLFLEMYHGGVREKMKNLLFIPLAMLISRRAARIITDSHFSKADILRRLKADSGKVEVVYINTSEGLFPEKDLAESERVRRKYGVGYKYILYIGNFKAHKNVGALVDAFRLLQEEEVFKDYSLVLGGNKDARATAIEKKIRDSGLEGRALFTGHLEESDLRGLYSAASLFVFPSLYEGYGLPVMEAMACGTPVACSNRTSLPEIAGGAAVLFDPENPGDMAEAIRPILLDEAKRGELIRKGLERVRKLNEKPCPERLFEILLSSARQGQGGAAGNPI